MSIYAYMENEEVFKPIEGFEDYEISNYGRVKSLKSKRILKPSNTNMYSKVSLWKNGKGYFKLVHRLVARAFIPNQNNLPNINHKDENPQNNKAENLEWCTQKYNNNYGRHNEKLSASKKGHIVSEETRAKISATKKKSKFQNN